MKAKGAKRKSKEELSKIQEEYQQNLPESEVNPNHKEDFNKLLAAAITKTHRSNPKKKRKGVKD